jgi:integrase/recombinase XerC
MVCERGCAVWAEIDGYGRWLTDVGRSEGTRSLRLYHVRRFAAAHPDPWAVALVDVERWIGAQHAPETRKSWLASLRGFYRWASEHGRAPAGWTDPAARMPTPRIPESTPRPCPPEVFARAQSGADDDTELMLLLGAHAGLRCAEIARVHTGDVIGDELRVIGKGERVRMVPLTPALLGELAARPRGWVFPGRFEGHVKPGTVGAKLARALGGGGWSAHTLRHAAGTNAFAADRDIRAVQMFLGHSSPTTTQRYVAVAPGGVRAGVEAAAAAMPMRPRLRAV